MNQAPVSSSGSAPTSASSLEPEKTLLDYHKTESEKARDRVLLLSLFDPRKDNEIPKETWCIAEIADLVKTKAHNTLLERLTNRDNKDNDYTLINIMMSDISLSDKAQSEEEETLVDVSIDEKDVVMDSRNYQNYYKALYHYIADSTDSNLDSDSQFFSACYYEVIQWVVIFASLLGKEKLIDKILEQVKADRELTKVLKLTMAMAWGMLVEEKPTKPQQIAHQKLLKLVQTECDASGAYSEYFNRVATGALLVGHHDTFTKIHKLISPNSITVDPDTDEHKPRPNETSWIIHLDVGLIKTLLQGGDATKQYVKKIQSVFTNEKFAEQLKTMLKPYIEIGIREAPELLKIVLNWARHGLNKPNLMQPPDYIGYSIKDDCLGYLYGLAIYYACLYQDRDLITELYTELKTPDEKGATIESLSKSTLLVVKREPEQTELIELFAYLPIDLIKPVAQSNLMSLSLPSDQDKRHLLYGVATRAEEISTIMTNENCSFEVAEQKVRELQQNVDMDEKTSGKSHQPLSSNPAAMFTHPVTPSSDTTMQDNPAATPMKDDSYQACDK